MSLKLHPSIVRAILAIAVLAAPVGAAAQTPQNTAPRPSFDRIPGVSVGAGVASVGTEGTPWTVPLTASVRVELTRWLVVDLDWMQPTTAHTLDVIEDYTPSTLNGQTGIYGRHTYDDRFRLGMRSVTVLAKAQEGRFTYLAGGGIGTFDTFHESTRTHAGCSGRYLPYCASPTEVFASTNKGSTLIVVGEISAKVAPRLDAFVHGRIGGSNAGEEAAVTIGLRAALIPDRERRGSRAKTARDTILNGLIIGAAAGGGFGLYLATYDEPRTIPASALIGSGIGAVIDALFSRRR